MRGKLKVLKSKSKIKNDLMFDLLKTTKIMKKQEAKMKKKVLANKVV